MAIQRCIVTAMLTTQSIILELRKRGLTQTEIAKKTGIPQPRICRWEAGDVPKSVDDAFALNRLLDKVKKAA